LDNNGQSGNNLLQCGVGRTLTAHQAHTPLKIGSTIRAVTSWENGIVWLSRTKTGKFMALLHLEFTAFAPLSSFTTLAIEDKSAPNKLPLSIMGRTA
jgi:hypothetical protein